MTGLKPIMGPQRTVGRSLAGELVPPEEVLQDFSPWVVVWVDSDLHDSLCLSPDELLRPPSAKPVDVLGYQVQCEVCPQTAIVAWQLSSWLCPRCAEVAEPADGRAPWDPAWAKDPNLFDGDDRDRVSVQLADGTLWTGPAADADAIKRGTEVLGGVLKAANDLLEVICPAARRVNGFGDIDVAAAEPLLCAMQSSTGRVCTKADGHKGDPHTDTLGWFWWYEDGWAYRQQVGPPTADDDGPDLWKIRG